MAKTKTRPRPKTKAHQKKTSTALVKRAQAGIKAAAAASHTNGTLGPILATEPTMMTAFIGTLKLSDKQIKALRRPVEDAEVEWRPMKEGGPPAIPYLSHNGYRDRLDAAFGLGGWGIAEIGVAREKDGIVYVPCALVVGGVPRVTAWGEQAYYPNNKQMTYGDALAGAKSNAITRCGKELGIARELWSRRYIEALKRRVLRAGAPSRQRDGDGTKSRDTAPPIAHTGREQEVISDAQRKRLFVIAKKHGRTEVEIKGFLQETYKIKSTKDITRQDYEAICTAIEGSGSLGKPPDVKVPDAVFDADSIPWDLSGDER